MEECNKVRDILKVYEEASGKKINRSKTSLFFGKSIPKDVKHGIKVTLGVLEIIQYEKYLGLPSLVGKGKKRKFQLHKGECMAEASRMGSQITFSSWKGIALKGSYISYPNLHDGMLQIASRFVQ